MTVAPDRWRHICGHFETVLALAGEARAAYLGELGRLEPDLSDEVASLLKAHDRLESVAFLDPAIRLVAGGSGIPPGEAKRSVGAYRLLRELGRGGMGTVYLAERADDAHRRLVALKVLSPGLEAAPLVERFERERRILAQLDHPHIARLLDGGAMPDGRPFLVMDWVDGERSDRYCAGAGLDARARLELFRKVCLAVHHAHQRGIVHGDIKPANILVAPDGDPKLLDFGVARLLGALAGSAVGASEPPRPRRGGSDAGDSLTSPALTPAYASPEQLLRRPLTTASDVYSLGIVLFQLLTGMRPFPPLEVHGSGLEELGEAVACRRAPRLSEAAGGDAPTGSRGAWSPEILDGLDPDTFADLERVVARALAASPAERHPTAGDLARDVARLLAGEPVGDSPRPWRSVLRRYSRRYRPLVAVAAAGLMTLAGIAAVLLLERWRNDRRETLALRFGQQAQEILSIARAAPLLPPDLSRAQVGRLRRKVEEVRSQAAALGADAEGPAAYPLGVGSFALGDYVRAQELLERAWNDGFTSPSIALALGETLGARYRLALREAARIGPLELRRAARRRATTELRDPAMRYLREASAEDPRVAAVLEASLAFYDDRVEEAVEKAKLAFERAPWLYEAKRLEGEIYLEHAARARDRDDFAVAVDWLERAGAVYARALAVARSEPQLRAAECWRRATLYELYRQSTGAEDRLFSEATAACEQALALAPDLVEVWVEKARLHHQRGKRRFQSGASADADLAEAERLARKAIEIEPSYARADVSLCAILREVVVVRGEDSEGAGELLLEAQEVMGRATTLDPNSAEAFNGLGSVCWQRARAALRSGGDATRELGAAIASYERSLELVPDYGRAHNNIGACQIEDAVHRGQRGEDAEPTLRAAAASFRRAIAVSPQVPLYFSNLGNADLELAFLRHRQRGEVPESLISSAEESYRSAIRIDPRFHLAWFNLALAHKLRGRVQLARGEDPRASLERALAALEESERLNPTVKGSAVERAEILLLRARWLAARGGDPREDLRRADAALERALTADASDLQGLLVRAEAMLFRARWAKRTSGAMRLALEVGRAAAARVRDADPNDAKALAILAAFDVVEAGSAPNPRRHDLALAAASALERALELDRFLEPHLSAFLVEARTLAGGAASDAQSAAASRPP